MAFLSRSARDTTLVRATSTLPRVGPGTYDVPRILEGKCDRVQYAPFGSGSGREISNPHSEVPAPGSYIEPIQWKHSASASWNAFKSSTPRFHDQIDGHDAQRPIGIEHTAWASPRATHRPKRPSPIQKSPAAPVIPSIPANNFGYIMAPDGTLQPRPPPEATAPPAGETGTPSSRGTVFGKGAERWRPNAGSLSPGPGQYNPVDPGKMLFDKGKFSRLMSSFAARTQRDDTVASAGPGPGQYEIPSKIRKSVVPPKFQNFGSRTSRWTETVDDDEEMPGPGSYNPDRSPQYIRLRPPPVPFNSLTERFSEPVRDVQPGPQDYNLPSSIRKPTSKADAPFGSRRERFERLREPEPRPRRPSPGADRHALTTRRTRRPRPRAPAWKALQHRQHAKTRRRPGEPWTCPAPGAYEVDRVTTAFRPERYKAKGFQFAPRTRLPPRPDHVLVPLITDLNHSGSPRSPRPIPKKKPASGTSSFRSHVDRFACDPTVAIRNRNPGPGEYGDLRPKLLKRTFNVTIDPEFDRIPVSDHESID